MNKQSQAKYVNRYSEAQEQFDEMQHKLYQIATSEITEKEFRVWIANTFKENQVSVLKSINTELQIAMKQSEANVKTTRNMSVLYITGQSKAGKTSLAEFISQHKYGPENIYTVGTGSHGMDGYKGQRCIVWNDFRGSLISPSEFFNLLDPYSNTPIDARYHNVDIANCELFILTSIKRPQELWPKITGITYDEEGNELPPDEQAEQIYRRLRIGNLDHIYWELSADVNEDGNSLLTRVYKLDKNGNATFLGNAPTSGADAVRWRKEISQANNLEQDPLFQIQPDKEEYPF